MLKRQGFIKDWYDRRIGLGQEWEGVISEDLEISQIVLPVISRDFLASLYSDDIEMKRALEKHRASEARVIPVIVRRAPWKECTLFAHLQPLPTNGRPILSWPSRDDAWQNVYEGIHQVVDELSTKESERNT
jgi:hypothetical protein